MQIAVLLFTCCVHVHAHVRRMSSILPLNVCLLRCLCILLMQSRVREDVQTHRVGRRWNSSRSPRGPIFPCHGSHFLGLHTDARDTGTIRALDTMVLAMLEGRGRSRNLIDPPRSYLADARATFADPTCVTIGALSSTSSTSPCRIEVVK